MGNNAKQKNNIQRNCNVKSTVIDNMISSVKEEAQLHIKNAKAGMKNALSELGSNKTSSLEKQDAWNELPQKERRLKEMEKVEKVLEEEKTL